LGKDNDERLNVSAMASFGQKFLLVGFEKGHLSVVNLKDYKIVANLTLPHKESKN